MKQSNCSPSERSMYVSHLGGTVSSKSVPSGWDSSAKPRYGRIDIAVTADPNLKDKSVRVYCAMATLERGGLVTAGIREIARAATCSKGATERRIDELVEYKHVKVNPAARGRRQSYTLLSPIFSGKNSSSTAQKSTEAATEEDLKANENIRHLACGICKKKRRNLPTTGICRTCTEVRDALAMAEKMPNATLGQVHAEVRASKSKVMQEVARKRRKRTAA